MTGAVTHRAVTHRAVTHRAAAEEVGRRRRRARRSRRYARPRGTPAWKASKASRRTKTKRMRTSWIRGLGPGEASAADVRESLLPPLMALTRGATDRVSGGRIADAMRAWGRTAAADARACVRAACIACIAAVQPGGEYAVAEPGGRNASPESFSGGGRDGIIQRAIGALPPSVFAVVVRAVTAALAGHFARADIVRSAVRSALGTRAAPGRRRRRRRTKNKKRRRKKRIRNSNRRVREGRVRRFTGRRTRGGLRGGVRRGARADGRRAGRRGEGDRV